MSHQREPAFPGEAMRGVDLMSLDPIPALLKRVRAELAAEFLPNRPIRISRAPGRLDVMGGIADYTGSLICEATLDRAAAIALQRRDDRNVQILSFNLFDENRPFTFRIPLDALASHSIDALRSEFNQPGRRWAGYLAGCLAILHHHRRIGSACPIRALRGWNLAGCSALFHWARGSAVRLPSR